MTFTLGTFNVNNLFSRYNFDLQAEVPELKEGAVAIEKIKTIIEQAERKEIDYKGIGLHRKDPAERKTIAERIKTMNLDVLCAQEIEDIDTLHYFVTHELNGFYPHVMLIEGNDPRLIDVAVMSKYPIGAATTWQTASHPEAPGERVFSRDMLQVEILNKAGTERLLTVFVNHLKSKFVPFMQNQTAGTKAANSRRRLQAETIAKIVHNVTRPDSAFAILGDMNDTPDADILAPFAASPRLQLTNGLQSAEETRPAPQSSSPPDSPVWTHRFKPSGKPAQYELFDQIWLSKSLAAKQTGAFIERRTKMGGNGSDHDPAWVVLDI
ncbi:MAG TPA: endonuclease/exonuclease/phosphatase family protein [Magnetospirillaceae bacterium]|nr:endonuclease/exonuclease/phosphatase family protein [Magnetospirillaceae bacterium]